MKRKKFDGKIIGLIMVLMCLTAYPAYADLSVPVWPAPGGTFYSASGDSSTAGKSGGLTYSYWGFDSSRYGNLYWGSWEGTTIGASLDGSNYSGSEIMQLASFADNRAVWTGQSTWSYYLNGTQYSNQAINTRLTLTVFPATTDLIDAATLGKASLGVLAPVNGNYSVNLLFEADYFGTWLPLLEGYNRYHTLADNQVNSTFSGGFYYTPPSTSSLPEPATLLLLGLAITGLAGLRKRIRK